MISTHTFHINNNKEKKMCNLDSVIAFQLASLGFFAEDSEKSEDVENYLEKLTNQEDEDDQVLMFDPQTGELVVQNKKDERLTPDSVIATSIAKDGFFKR
jgi:hypothetical protein